MSLATIPAAAGPTLPDLSFEHDLWNRDARVVVGIDEVGRGAWAGPCSVAAVVATIDPPEGIRDSKQLSPKRRAVLANEIRSWTPAWAIGHASPAECDEFGMTAALRLAGQRALAEISATGLHIDHVLLDGSHDFLRLGHHLTTIVKGDTRSIAIAAASIVAKHARDELMAQEAENFPAYGFERNAGYPAPVHRTALAAYGPTTIHRVSWSYMDDLPWRRNTPNPGQLF